MQSSLATHHVNQHSLSWYVYLGINMGTLASHLPRNRVIITWNVCVFCWLVIYDTQLRTMLKTDLYSCTRYVSLRPHRQAASKPTCLRRSGRSHGGVHLFVWTYLRIHICRRKHDPPTYVCVFHMCIWFRLHSSTSSFLKTYSSTYMYILCYHFAWPCCQQRQFLRVLYNMSARGLIWDVGAYSLPPEQFRLCRQTHLQTARFLNFFFTSCLFAVLLNKYKASFGRISSSSVQSSIFRLCASRSSPCMR